jgi:hypothetical protein
LLPVSTFNESRHIDPRTRHGVAVYERTSINGRGFSHSLGHQLTVTNDGYVMNDLDWRVRSPRALALCSALYECEPVRSV